MAKANKKKMSAKISTNKKPAVRKTSAKLDPINTLKAGLQNLDKAFSQSISQAKQQVQTEAKNAKQLVDNLKEQHKKAVDKEKAALQKFNATQAKLKQKATATNQKAVEKAQKTYAETQKATKLATKALANGQAVVLQVKNLKDKFSTLAKELNQAEKDWKQKIAQDLKQAKAKSVAKSNPASTKPEATPKQAKSPAKAKSASTKPEATPKQAKSPAKAKPASTKSEATPKQAKSPTKVNSASTGTEAASKKVKPAAKKAQPKPTVEPEVKPEAKPTQTESTAAKPDLINKITPQNIVNKPLTGGFVQYQSPFNDPDSL